MTINKYLIFALGFAVVNAAAVFFVFGFQWYSDSESYTDAVRWLKGGGSVDVDPWIILKPLSILLASPFEFLGAGTGLIIQNILFYLLSAVLVFKITDLIFDNKKQALLASMFFVTITQVLEVGLAYLTDMGAWFFYLLSIFLTLLYLKNKNGKLIILNGFISGLGVLMKENGGLGALFFGLMILFSGEFGIKEKISKILRFAVFFLIPIILWQGFMYWQFRLTSLDWYIFQLKAFSDDEEATPLVFKYFGQLFRTLGILWIFFFVGLWRELREINWQRLRIYLALLPGSFSFFLWPISAGGRSSFIFAPLGILLAACGIKKIKPIFLALIFILVLVLNYWFVFVNQRIPFTDIIYTLLFSR